MNVEQRRNLLYRLISGTLVILCLAFMIFSLVYLFIKNPEHMLITAAGLAVSIFLAVLQSFFLFKNIKKVSVLEQIAFNENGKINNVPIFGVIGGVVFGIAFLTLGLIVFFIENDLEVKCAMLFVVSVGIYLLINCAIYGLYLLMFHKRKLDLKDFIK